MAELLRTHALESRVDALAAAGVTVDPYLPMANVRGAQAPDAGIRLGPDEWLVLGDAGPSATDVSAQRITLYLTGDHARDVLAKGCAIDLHPVAFPVGSSVQTLLAQAVVILTALDDGYRIIVRSSFAGYLADWLLDATIEFR
ncbi:sarcosine oxidase subunit gamma [Cryptosporangium japonicum]|uniref:Sarcosine oxidase subunit gamma n=1 Tax=Cryptosporangium japonicum TaxID=80872 RepID=A0ABP3DM68_9ACTN